MDSNLKKRLRTAFDESLPQMMPGFQKTHCNDLMPGERVYQYTLPSGISYFVFLLESPKRNEFTLEGAISYVGEFPAYCSLMNPQNVRMPDGTIHPTDKVRQGQFRARAGTFCDVYDDKWWLVDSGSINQAVKEAIAFFRDKMFPLLMSLAKSA